MMVTLSHVIVMVTVMVTSHVIVMEEYRRF